MLFMYKIIKYRIIKLFITYIFLPLQACFLLLFYVLIHPIKKTIS